MNFKSHLLGLLAVVLVGCGGGGGGGTSGTQVTAQRLDQVATLTYQATNLTAFAYDPWTPIRLEPVLTGVPSSGARHYRANLPKGLAIDPATGVIAGLADSSSAFFTTINISVSVDGFASEKDSTYTLRVNGLNPLGSIGDGFSFMGSSPLTIKGTVGVAGYISNEIRQAVYASDGLEIAHPLPAGAVVSYGLGPSTASGAVINADTGRIDWTPGTSGQFTLVWFADVTVKGVTRRYTHDTLTLTIS